MKKLSNKRISELIDKAINDMNEWNNSHTIDEYVINSIRNINLIDDENYVEERNALHDKLIQHMNDTRDLYRGYQWRMRPWRKDFVPNWENEGYTRQRENEEYEPRQLDYDTGLPMKEAVRKKC